MSNGENLVQECEKRRAQGNELVLAWDHLGIKRFYNLDANTYRDAQLLGKTRDLLRLVVFLLLRCNECVDYHLLQCVKARWSKEELVDAMSVPLLVGARLLSPTLAMLPSFWERWRRWVGATKPHRAPPLISDNPGKMGLER